MKRRMFDLIDYVIILSLVVGFTMAAHCQMPLGTVNNPQPVVCPTGFAHGAVCQTATVSCPPLPDIAVTFGVSGSGALGTIVFVNGSGNTIPAGGGFASNYEKAGYSVAQFIFTPNAPASYWELGAGNILQAACRPATILKYFQPIGGNYDRFRESVISSSGSILTRLHVSSLVSSRDQTQRDTLPPPAFCAQGTSAGSGAVAYAMAQYGVHFDAVELIDGPVFSAIDQGCEVPNVSPVTVIPTNGIPWQDSPIYNLESGSMTQWTGNKCLPKVGTTTAAEAQAWAGMSILAPGAVTSFPTTALAHWVCDNGLNPSAAQSYLWFSQVTGFSSTLTQLSGCTGAEGTNTSVTPQGVPANAAITADLIQACTAH